MDNQLIDQQPPHSDEAERAVLGGIFLNADTLPDAQEYVWRMTSIRKHIGCCSKL